MKNWIIKECEVCWGIYYWEIYEFILPLFDLGYIVRTYDFEIMFDSCVN